RCVCGKKIGPDPRNFNQRVSLGRNDLLIRTFPRSIFNSEGSLNEKGSLALIVPSSRKYLRHLIVSSLS
ncbi:hypothetical protein LRP16_25740, partial [Klebsiella pneumoniae]|nr:hypothetical protein [Klebsiella pneumoniae]